MSPERFPDKKQSSIDYDRVTSFLKEAQQISKEAKVGQKEATWVIEPDYPNLPVVVLLASDIHYGSMGVDYKLLDRHLNIVERTPNIYACFNGDQIDNFSPTVIPDGMLNDPISPQMQAQVFMERLSELDRKSKIGLLAHGNHDDWIRAAGYDFYQTFMREFEAPVFDEGGILNMVVQGVDYRMAVNHQFWGKSKINMTNQPKRMIEYMGGGEVDIGWVGHTHQAGYEHFDKGPKDLIAVVSGTYKQDDAWGKKKGIDSHAGMPGISLMLWPYERRMEVFKDIEVAQDFMIAMITEYETPEQERKHGKGV